MAGVPRGPASNGLVNIFSDGYFPGSGVLDVYHPAGMRKMSYSPIPVDSERF